MKTRTRFPKLDSIKFSRYIREEKKFLWLDKNKYFIKTIPFLSSCVSRPYTTSQHGILEKKIKKYGYDMELNETEEIINPRPTMVPLLILTSSFSQQLERKKNSISAASRAKKDKSRRI